MLWSLYLVLFIILFYLFIYLFIYLFSLHFPPRLAFAICGIVQIMYTIFQIRMKSNSAGGN